MIEAIIRVLGRVQGVFYRAFAQKTALDLGLTGWARNNADGSVTICAQGTEEHIEKFIEHCRKGPAGAGVTDMQVEKGMPKQVFKDFKISY